MIGDPEPWPDMAAETVLAELNIVCPNSSVSRDSASGQGYVGSFHTIYIVSKLITPAVVMMVLV